MAIGQLDLHLLVALDALLRERHVSRAAERVGLTPSGMSKTLQRLRTIFDDPLLARAGHEYRLTPMAEDLVEPVQEILWLMERLERGTEFQPERDRRTFRIAAHDSAVLLVRPLLDRMLREAPGVSVSLEPPVGRPTAELLEAGELDLALRALDSVESRLCQEPLYIDRVVGAVWAPREDVRDRLTMEQFTSMPRVNYYWPEHRHLDERFPEWLTSEDLPVRVIARSPLLRLHVVRGTPLLAITYEKLAQSLAESAEVRTVELPFDAPSVQRGMVWHPRHTADPAHRWLREQLVEIAREL
jgi:LysR family transcriptional regulator, nod-box dependent transcriptional activator